MMALTAYGYFYPVGDWNTFSRLSLVKAVVEENHFEIDSYHRTSLPTEDEAFFNGHYYSDKAIGTALLGMEFYFPLLAIYNVFGWRMDIITFQQLVTFFAVSLITAFLAPLFFSLVKQISGDRWFALFISAAVCLGTPIYIYSTVFYGHVLAGLFLFVVFLLWFNMQNEGQISPFKTFISGYLLAFAFITEYTTSIIVFALLLYIAYILRKKEQLLNPRVYIFLALGIFLPLAVAMTYNYTVFKNPFSTGYSYEASELYSKAQLTGFMGIGLPNLKVLFYLTFHTTMGIFWQSPVLLLAFPGWVAMWRGNNSRYRIEGILSFGIILLYFLAISGYFAWWGGLAYSPRFVIPALPFFIIPLAFLPQKLYKVAFFLTLISILQMFVAVASTNFGLYEITMRPGLSSDNFYEMFQNSTIYNVALQNFRMQSFNANFGHQLFGLEGPASLIPFLIAEVLILIVFFNVDRLLPKTRQMYSQTEES